MNRMNRRGAETAVEVRMRKSSIVVLCVFLCVLCASAVWFFTQAPPADKSLSEQIEAKGRRISVFAPAGDEPTATRIAEAGDKALERYATDLGVEIPNVRFKIFIYGTVEEYEK